MSESRWMVELRKLERNGRLQAESVVNAAKDEGSALHSHFTWNDGEAGEKWRLHEARNLIRVYSSREMAKEEPNADNVFVSLRADRGSGGYRTLSKILSDDELREQLLQDAMEDMKYFKLKYKKLSELTVVFSAMDQVEQRKSRGKLKRAA